MDVLLAEAKKSEGGSLGVFVGGNGNTGGSGIALDQLAHDNQALIGLADAVFIIGINTGGQGDDFIGCGYIDIIIKEAQAAGFINHGTEVFGGRIGGNIIEFICITDEHGKDLEGHVLLFGGEGDLLVLFGKVQILECNQLCKHYILGAVCVSISPGIGPVVAEDAGVFAKR